MVRWICQRQKRNWMSPEQAMHNWYSLASLAWLYRLDGRYNAAQEPVVCREDCASHPWALVCFCASAFHVKCGRFNLSFIATWRHLRVLSMDYTIYALTQNIFRHYGMKVHYSRDKWESSYFWTAFWRSPHGCVPRTQVRSFHPMAFARSAYNI